MSRVLIGVLGYGDRTPDDQALRTICKAESIAAMLVLWHRPGPGVKASLGRLQADSPKVDVEFNTDNPGSAGGYARLLGKAADFQNWDYLLLLDDDLDISPEAIQHLVAVVQSLPGRSDTLLMAYRHGLSELRDLAEHGRPLRDIRPGACIGFHLLNLLGIGGRHTSRVNEGTTLLESAPYGGLFIPRACLTRLGLPIEPLFLYADDAEWTLRFTRAGGTIRLVTDAPISDRTPSWNATSTAGGNIARRVLHLGRTKAYYEARNRNFLARKYYPGRRFVYLTNRLFFLGAVYLLAVVNRKFGRARLIHRAIDDGDAMARCAPSAWPSPPPGLD